MGSPAAALSTNMKPSRSPLLIILLSTVHCDPGGSSSSSGAEVLVGEEAVLECRVSGAPVAFCTFTSPTKSQYIIKKGLSHDNGRITYHGQDENRDCGIKISNVQESDNGNWKCVITVCNDSGGCSPEEGIAQVTVIKAPTKVYLQAGGQEVSAIDVPFPKQETKKVTCVAEGGRPAPKFMWQLGGKKNLGKLSEIKTEESEDGGIKTIQTLTLTVNPDDTGKNLTCIAEHPGISDKNKNTKANKASVKLNINYPPIPQKADLDLYDYTLEKEAIVEISFKAFPSPTQVVWELSNGVVLKEGEESSDGRLKARTGENTGADGLRTARLEIGELKSEDSGVLQSLRVTNTQGTTQYKFILHTSKEGVQSTAVVTVVIIAALVVLVIILAFVAKSRQMLCFMDQKGEQLVEKGSGNFDAIEKGDSGMEKEPIKEFKQENQSPGQIIISVNKPEEQHTCEKSNKVQEEEELKFNQVQCDSSKQLENKQISNEKNLGCGEKTSPKEEEKPEYEKKLIDTNTDNSGS